jgi:hypothetical protein
MKITETYSHLNCLEFLLVHKAALWDEIRSVISKGAANTCRTKVSKEKRMAGELLFSSVGMNVAFEHLLRSMAWNESRAIYW